MIPDSLKKYSFFRLPDNVLLIAAAVVFTASIMIYGQSFTWSGRQDYSYGYLMPLFALYVIYDRWGKVLSFFASSRSSDAPYSFFDKLVGVFFAVTFVCSLLVYAVAAFFFGSMKNYGAPVFILSFAFSFLFYSLAYFASQRNAAGVLMPVSERLKFTSIFTFSAFGWLISAPLFDGIQTIISQTLLGWVSVIVFYIMDLFGYVVTLHNNVLSFPKGQVGVADACSGIRSLTACLFAGSFLAAVFLDKFWKKVLMVLLSMCFAFFNNLLRALFLAFWSYYYGPESISGAVHDYAGYFVMGMTIIELLVLMPLFQLSAVPKEFRDAK